MKWKITLEIESHEPTANEISNAKQLAEEVVLEALKYKVKFINTTANRTE